eukprot:s1113_g19.t3
MIVAFQPPEAPRWTSMQLWPRSGQSSKNREDQILRFLGLAMQSRKLGVALELGAATMSDKGQEADGSSGPLKRRGKADKHFSLSTWKRQAEDSSNYLFVVSGTAPAPIFTALDCRSIEKSQTLFADASIRLLSCSDGRCWWLRRDLPGSRPRSRQSGRAFGLRWSRKWQL